MKAYGKNKTYDLENYRPSGIPGTAKAFTKGFKEEIRNANRSRKKSERQEVRMELRKYL